MFCLNEEDEEDGLLQPVSGKDFIIHFILNFLPSNVSFPRFQGRKGFGL